MLDVAAHAPTGVNARQMRVTVIDDTASMDAFRKEVYQRLENLVRENRMPENPRRQFFSSAPELWRKGLDPIFRHAPHCVLVSNAKDASCREQDSLIYLSYFELMAQSGGLGTVWCGLVRPALLVSAAGAAGTDPPSGHSGDARTWLRHAVRLSGDAVSTHGGTRPGRRPSGDLARARSNAGPSPAVQRSCVAG